MKLEIKVTVSRKRRNVGGWNLTIGNDRHHWFRRKADAIRYAHKLARSLRLSVDPCKQPAPPPFILNSLRHEDQTPG